MECTTTSGEVKGTYATMRQKENCMTTLIIVSGPSASGKSTLSHRLSKDLKIPMICRDDIKEAMFDSMKKAEGVTDRQRSIEYGSAASLILVREVEEFLSAGVSCIIEAKFNPKFSQAELSELIEKTGANAMQIQTVCDGQVLYDRFKHRSLRAERHPGHGDSGNAEEFKDELLAGRYPALNIDAELLEYDTTQEDENAYQDLLTHTRKVLQ